MRKMNHFTFNDIVQKRVQNNKNKNISRHLRTNNTGKINT